MSALYYNPSSDEVEDIMELNVNQFEEVLVGLNMVAIITPTSQSSSLIKVTLRIRRSASSATAARNAYIGS